MTAGTSQSAASAFSSSGVRPVAHINRGGRWSLEHCWRDAMNLGDLDTEPLIEGIIGSGGYSERLGDVASLLEDAGEIAVGRSDMADDFSHNPRRCRPADTLPSAVLGSLSLVP